MTNKPQKGLKELQRAACKNGKQSSRDVLTMEVSIMQAGCDIKEI